MMCFAPMGFARFRFLHRARFLVTMLLQDALARHHVEKNPADFKAHCNLAAMLEPRNRLEAAIREYHLAVKLRPHDAARK